MGKRQLTLLFTGLLLIARAQSGQNLFDYKELGWDTSRTGAETAFAVRFSDSRVFNCHKNGELPLTLGVSAVFKGAYPGGGKSIESGYERKFNKPFDWSKSGSYINIEAGIETKSGYKKTYDSIGMPLFDSNGSKKYMVVELLNGMKIEFTRFGPIPDFPFNTKKKLQPFFYYQVAGEPRYECSPVDQPD